MSRSFINQMRKDDLCTGLKELGLDDQGTVDELRARLRKYLDKEDLPTNHVVFINELRSKYDTTDVTKELKVPTPCISRSASSMPDYGKQMSCHAEICNKVRKWGVKYDGKKESLCFLELIEELATCYSISKTNLLNYMPELLKGDALLWYRNNKSNWESYEDFVEDFKLFFLPIKFFETLEDKVRNRKQYTNESFVDYVTALQSLMRWTNITSEAQLARIFMNCRAEYKLYITGRSFTTLRELISLAQEYESIRAEDISERGIKHIQTAVASTKKPTLCFRCGESGHYRSSCSNPQILFCWNCGKKGVKTIDCCRKNLGNGRRDSPIRDDGVDL